MDSRRLSCFLKLSETLHFGRAAEELGIAQSALSRQIQLLEREIGCSLFDRSNRWNVSLTPGGEAFVPEALKLVEQAERAKQVTLAAARGEQGTLDIEIVSSAMNFPPFLQALHEMRVRHPGVQLNIQEGVSSGIYERVRRGEADLGILRIAAAADEELVTEPLARNRLLMAIPRKHPLAAKERLFLHDFIRERFIVPRARVESLPASILELVCRRAGFSPDIALKIENMAAILHILPALNCVTLVPDLFAGKYDGVVFRALEDYSETLPLTAIRHRDNPSLILKNFLTIQLAALKHGADRR